MLVLVRKLRLYRRDFYPKHGTASRFDDVSLGSHVKMIGMTKSSK